jgi:hypothetical protein
LEGNNGNYGGMNCTYDNDCTWQDSSSFCFNDAIIVVNLGCCMYRECASPPSSSKRWWLP